MKTKKLKEDLAKLLDYLWDDESKHFVENKSRDHIFLVMKKLAKKINFQEPNFTMFPAIDSKGAKIVYQRNPGVLRCC